MVDPHGFAAGADREVFDSARVAPLAALAVAYVPAVDADRRGLEPMPAWWRRDREAGLEKPMASKLRVFDSKPEHGPAQRHRIFQRRAGYVLDAVGNARRDQHVPRLRYQIDVRFRVVHRPHGGVRLARRRRADQVERSKEVDRQAKDVGLNEFEGKPLLMRQIDADDFEAGAMQADGDAAGTAEQIKRAKLPGHQSTTVNSFAARVTAVYRQRQASSRNAAPSSKTSTLSHCEPCALWTVSA